ncbi:MAG: hypothetical protein AMXMBFR84_09360 [Candidatus Hydrogenedentota bacterium]
MTAATQSAQPRSLVAPFLIVAFAACVIVATVGWAELGLAFVIGCFFFVIYLRDPAIGLYITTALLLMGGLNLSLAGISVSIPQAAPKLSGLATVGAWFFNLLVTRRPIKVHSDFWFAVAFMAWAALGIIWQVQEMWGVLAPQWGRLANVVVLFIIAIHIIDDSKKVKTYVSLILACGVGMSLFAVMQYLVPSMQFSGVGGIEAIGGGQSGAFIDPELGSGGGAVRVSGTLGHSTWLAYALLMILPLNTYWYSMAKTRRQRLLVYGAIGVELIALVLTFTRMGFIVGVVIVTLMLGKQMMRLSPYRLSALAVGLVIVWLVLPEAYKDRVLSPKIYDEGQSTEARIELQEYAYQYALDRPITGIGLGGFGFKFMEENSWVAQMLRWMVRYWGWDPIHYGPHSMYLQLASETGFVGLLLLLAFVFVAFRNAMRAEKLYRAAGDQPMALLSGAVVISLVAFLMCSFFLHGLNQKIWWMVVVIASTLPYAYAADQEAKAANGGSTAKGARTR